METNVKIVGFANESFNGRTVSSKGFDVNYDGNVADINAFSDGKVYYMRLGNQDIQNLLNIPSSTMPLEERLALECNKSPQILKYKNIRHMRRPSTVKKTKSKRRKNIHFRSRSKSTSRSRNKTTRKISRRIPTPYYKRKNQSSIPSIEKTVY